MLKVSGKLDCQSFLDIAKQYRSQCLQTNSHNQIIIDLTQMTFADPFGIMGLTLLVRSVRLDTNTKCRVLLPSDSAAKSYLVKSGCLVFCSKHIECERSYLGTFDRVFGNLLKRNFIPLTPISSENDIGPINNQVESFLIENNYHYSKEEINDIQVMISELCQNVIYHSESAIPERGLFFMQGYKPKMSGKGKFCMVSIGDAGIGIRNSLNKNPRLENMVFSDCKAISLALKEGVSGVDGDRFRGNGLYDLNRLTKKHKANLYIHSHGGVVSYTFKESGRIKEENDIFPVIGTQVCFSLEEKR